jgi:hypothetical protein
MAARRLLIIMLVLLGISTLAAALVGNRPLREEGATGTVASGTETSPAETAPAEASPAEPVAAGEELTFNLRVGGEKVKVVQARVGDQIALLVRSRKPDLIEIPGLGLVEAASPQVPARFDILATEPAEYGVRLVDGKRVVARLEIRERKPKAKEPEPGA